MIFQTKEDVLNLIDKFEKSTLESFDIEIGSIKLSMKKATAASYSAPLIPIQRSDTAVAVATAPASVAIASVNEDLLGGGNSFVVKAPLVGTYYSRPSPELPSFAEVGKKVKKGDILCIIEAMKVMNEIECEHDGVIAEILVTNGSAVEFDQPILRMTLDN